MFPGRNCLGLLLRKPKQTLGLPVNELQPVLRLEELLRRAIVFDAGVSEQTIAVL